MGHEVGGAAYESGEGMLSSDKEYYCGKAAKVNR